MQNEDGFYLRISPGFVLKDMEDSDIEPRKTLSRRKKLCKSMYNEAWLNRLMAISFFLFGENEKCELFSSEEENISIYSRPLTFALQESL